MSNSIYGNHRYKYRPRNIDAFRITNEMALACIVDKQPWPMAVELRSAEYHAERRKVYSCKLKLKGTKADFDVEIGDWVVNEDGIVFPLTDAAFNRIYEIDLSQEPPQ